MTSYGDLKSEEILEKVLRKERELIADSERVAQKVTRFMELSPAIQQMKPEAWMEERARKNINSYLLKEYRQVSMGLEKVYPSFTIHQTNNPEVFAEYLETRNSMKFKCITPPNSFRSSKRYAYEQNRWSPLYNLRIKLRNPGANFRHSVDFVLEESYLLFGRKTNWTETLKKKNNGNDVEIVVDEPRVYSEPSKEFMLLLYVPATPDDVLFHTVTTLDEELERLTAPPKQEKKKSKGFFARLLGA